MELTKPCEELFEEYYHACKESYDHHVTEWMPFDPAHYDAWRETILAAYARYETGDGLPDGFPRTYTYWCTQSGTLIGEVQLRPFLTPEEARNWGHIAYAVRYSQWGRGWGTQLLKAAVQKLAAFGIRDIYVVCHQGNAASIRVIEKNGGLLQASVAAQDGTAVNCYLLPVVPAEDQSLS